LILITKVDLGAALMTTREPADMAFRNETGQIFMLNKKERILLRALLEKAIRSVSGRKWIAEKLGPEYVKIGLSLLKDLGGPSPSSKP
jgi:hypothetical protein